MDFYRRETLFLLCHGCVGAVMTPYEKTCDLSTFRCIAKSGHSTLALATCRSCIQQRTYQPNRQFWCSPRPDEFFHILHLSALIIKQMHAFQVTQAVARGEVHILSHERAAAYKSWNNVFRSLPNKYACSSIETGMRQGLVRQRRIMPYVPVALL